jgi:uncharacterized membrane protein AbrB (regulator of aidB expression)
MVQALHLAEEVVVHQTVVGWFVSLLVEAEQRKVLVQVLVLHLVVLVGMLQQAIELVWWLLESRSKA